VELDNILLNHKGVSFEYLLENNFMAD